MKATIRFTDGKTIEAEGTPEEIAKLAGGWTDALKYVYVTQPCMRQHFEWPQPVLQPWPYGVQPLDPGWWDHRIICNSNGTNHWSGQVVGIGSLQEQANLGGCGIS